MHHPRDPDPLAGGDGVGATPMAGGGNDSGRVDVSSWASSPATTVDRVARLLAGLHQGSVQHGDTPITAGAVTGRGLQHAD
jgi:hypothetical protein